MAQPLHQEALRLAVSLAAEALAAGDHPFGSVLVSATGNILQTDRNRVVTGSDATLHPELTLARWAEANLTPEERRTATVYTSGEHCPMCSAAHAYCGLGGIVYVASADMYAEWQREFGADPGRVRPLAIREVAPGIEVRGPVEEFAEEVKELHRTRFAGRA
ncbi:hypothetical protein S7711_03091 [Stachybotrys chartarum IBT 7711]|uniref:CMP/dCMP-type deaminase domain-containing protein n=1 Tax=Stachybotrys chartarum (strain CBS 109288 / IBT 7711) TaxID=1280523 RepID=A0A084B8A5_STACB|nr:hypothetical protein S7711_03091 [Stachybotrys chartarum IBT 7711]KFA54083.1 hypothetical protein S40293_05559 [Stachybotrys chartarum IBT 40293]